MKECSAWNDLDLLSNSVNMFYCFPYVDSEAEKLNYSMVIDMLNDYNIRIRNHLVF